MRIVHATETLVGGVLAAVAALANKQSEAGHDVSVVFPRKPAVPSAAELRPRFRSAVSVVELPYRGRLRAVPDLARSIRALAAPQLDVLHLHSTFAGVAGRTSPAIRRRVRVIAYSPHGFAFLRGSASAASNRAAMSMERLLKPRCDGIVLVSDSEAEIAREHLGADDCHVLRNGIPVDDLPIAAGSGRARPVVVASGRLGRQKAPDRFAEVARALEGRADFVWIGDGTPEERARWIGDAPVEVTGWLPHAEVIDRLAASDVFLFPTRWEGMPISLMEAQAMGVPAVATDIVGNRDVVIHGETGLLCADGAQVVEAVSRLVDEPFERQRMRETSIAVQRRRLSDADLGRVSIELYERMTARDLGAVIGA